MNVLETAKDLGQGIYTQAEIELKVPTAGILTFPINMVPTGFLECNGAALSRTAYADLFAVIGETYGAGDGSTTFNLPDLRGEFIRGFDNGRGIDSHRSIGSWQVDDFKSHSHSVYHSTSRQPNHYVQNTSWYSATNPVTGDTSSSGGTETRPRNIAMMYCIKY